MQSCIISINQSINQSPNGSTIQSFTYISHHHSFAFLTYLLPAQITPTVPREHLLDAMLGDVISHQHTSQRQQHPQGPEQNAIGREGGLKPALGIAWHHSIATRVVLSRSNCVNSSAPSIKGVWCMSVGWDATTGVIVA